MQQCFMEQTGCDMTFAILIPQEEHHAAAEDPPSPPQAEDRGRKRKIEESPTALRNQKVEIKAHSDVLAARSDYIK